MICVCLSVCPSVCLPGGLHGDAQRQARHRPLAQRLRCSMACRPALRARAGGGGGREGAAARLATARCGGRASRRAGRSCRGHVHPRSEYKASAGVAAASRVAHFLHGIKRPRPDTRYRRLPHSPPGACPPPARGSRGGRVCSAAVRATEARRRGQLLCPASRYAEGIGLGGGGATQQQAISHECLLLRVANSGCQSATNKCTREV